MGLAMISWIVSVMELRWRAERTRERAGASNGWFDWISNVERVRPRSRIDPGRSSLSDILLAELGKLYSPFGIAVWPGGNLRFTEFGQTERSARSHGCNLRHQARAWRGSNGRRSRNRGSRRQALDDAAPDNRRLPSTSSDGLREGARNLDRRCYALLPSTNHL